MALLKSFLIIILLSGCAKISYMTKQGMGQLSLQNRAISNDKALTDVRISPEHKDKIRKVGVYKKYFYNYFKRKSTPIYTQTTMLDSEAVTYLVIASRYDEIKAYKTCFPIINCVPYLGFFDKKDARDYREEMERKDYVTYQRPVYAYSTLGYFNDTILSSFFHYKDYQLAELIFHELFYINI